MHRYCIRAQCGDVAASPSSRARLVGAAPLPTKSRARRLAGQARRDDHAPFTLEETMGSTDAAFAGSIPALYERYLGPLMFQPYADDMAGRLRGLEQGPVLDTAAGTGIVTRAVARALPGVEIVATDLNQAML